MGLRLISRTMEEQNALPKRFGIAQDTPGKPEEEEDYGTIQKKLEVQQDLRRAIVNAAQILDVDVADSREKSLALTKFEEGLMWAGKAIFS